MASVGSYRSPRKFCYSLGAVGNRLLAPVGRCGNRYLGFKLLILKSLILRLLVGFTFTCSWLLHTCWYDLEVSVPVLATVAGMVFLTGVHFV